MPVTEMIPASADLRRHVLGEWRALCTVVLGDPAVAADARRLTMSGRVANRSALDTMIGCPFTQLEAMEMLRLLDEANIASSWVNQLRDFARHPQLVGRGRWQDVATPFGPVPGLLPVAPTLGEQTEQVVELLGFSAADRAAMRGDGFVRTNRREEEAA